MVEIVGLGRSRDRDAKQCVERKPVATAADAAAGPTDELVPAAVKQLEALSGDPRNHRVVLEGTGERDQHGLTTGQALLDPSEYVFDRPAAMIRPFKGNLNVSRGDRFGQVASKRVAAPRLEAVN
ncbi:MULTISPECIES: hypothetical protein [unclassified Sphingomonas]|uniref:hypothetical protein n=1 Tax=unclassified Sphingomonas TaxID=196159 RepID=UPI002150FD02|nr:MULTISPECIES: hypothetical protein [unclassified Sphingomonas]MCR5870709.1 hypothetical protein [Sphingomonas sp. J344]UUY00955.1 hypothetical protein LRS08_07835 [Sphingomonas sp. J315]